MLVCNGAERDCDSIPRESGLTSTGSSLTRTLGQPSQESRQMTGVFGRPGALSRIPQDWHAINWRHVYRHVRRLQARIVKATRQGRWGKVRALQHLLTHSFSAKALAVRRVTENAGKRRKLLKLWEQQQGLCPVCGQPVTPETGWHRHHVTWKAHGGTDEAENLLLLHPNCHRQVHWSATSV
jgi:5-methylcytosine-specific restriction endonuclease McrA